MSPQPNTWHPLLWSWEERGFYLSFWKILSFFDGFDFSPLYIDETVPNMEMTCRRVLWGKLLNAGQTCVAPDYILCTPKVQQKFLESAAKVIKEFYGEEPKNSEDFCRIVNQKHFERISKLMSSSGKAVIGGDSDSDQNYISPTILVDVSPNDPVIDSNISIDLIQILSKQLSHLPTDNEWRDLWTGFADCQHIVCRRGHRFHQKRRKTIIFVFV